MLEFIAERKGITLPQAGNDVDLNVEFDKLAALVRENVDMDHIRRAMALHSR